MINFSKKHSLKLKTARIGGKWSVKVRNGWDRRRTVRNDEERLKIENAKVKTVMIR